MTWNGLYVGLDAGVRATQADSIVTSATVGTPPVNIFTAPGIGSCGGFNGCPNGQSLDQIAARGGLFAGWNWQVNSYAVVGIEGDIGWGDKTKSLTGSPYPADLHFGAAPFIGFPLGGSPFDSFAITTKWDGSIRARGGVLVNPSTLVYATGGAAWLELRSTSTCSPIVSTSPVGILSNCAGGNYFTGTLGPSVISHDVTKVGWTIGGGIETRVLSTNWTARAEYRYSDYGTASFTDVRTCTGGCPATANPVQATSVMPRKRKLF